MEKTTSKRKAELMEQMANNCEGDQKNCFLSYILYLGLKYYSAARIYQLFYFGIFNKHVYNIEKINMIKMKFPLQEA